jgi:hypothetical protein
LVSNTDFATIALALADDAVKTAHAGDFVKIAGDFYHIIKTNPTIADDLLKGGGVEDFNELSNRPLQVPASEITAGAVFTASFANARAIVSKSVFETNTFT